MKKHLLLFFAPFIFFSLSAQITQKEADIKVTEHLSGITIPFTLYAHEDVQTGFEVLTSTGEKLKLAYSCWVYYVNFTEETNGKYLIVKESNGNILEANVKNDEGPEDLEGWRIVPPKNIPFEEYLLDDPNCHWKNLNYDETLIIINSNEELENYITCTEGSYPEVDFSQYTLLLVNGKINGEISKITAKKLLQYSHNKYELAVEIRNTEASATDEWAIALIVPKLSEGGYVELNITKIIEISYIDYYSIIYNGIPPCWQNITYHSVGNLIIINSSEQLENYFICTEDYPSIDFEENTLLVAYGLHTQGISYITKELIKENEDNYNFNIFIKQNSTLPIPRWVTAILISKISTDIVVTLTVSKY